MMGEGENEARAEGSERARTRGFGRELILDLGRGRAIAEQVLLGQLAAGGRHRGR